MTLDRPHLQLMAALHEFGRLGDAARALHLSPSAASHRLAEAERRAGTKLTESAGRTLKLTLAGEHLAQRAREIERDIDQALLTTRWIRAGEPDRIRVAVGFYDTAGWLLDTFAPSKGSPRIELLRFSDAGLLDSVRRGDADIAIAPWPKRPTGLDHVGLASDVLVAAVPFQSDLAANEIALASELSTYPFLASNYRAARGFEFHEFFLAAGIVPETVVQVQSLEMLLRLVGNGDGVTIQPSLVLAWNRPHETVSILPLAGPEIALEWTASFRLDAPQQVVDAAERIRGVFQTAKPPLK